MDIEEMMELMFGIYSIPHILHGIVLTSEISRYEFRQQDFKVSY